MKNLQKLITVLIFLTCFNLSTIAKPAVQTIQGNDPEALLQAGYKLMQQEKFDEALAVLEKVSRMLPNDYLPFALIGGSYQGQNKYKSASEAYAKAIRLNKQDKTIYIMKANVDLLRNELDESIAISRKLLEIDPNYAEAYVIIGKALQIGGKPRSEVIASYQSAIKADPKFLESYESLGSVLIGAKDEKGAEVVFRKGIEADPKKMTGRFPLSHLLVRQERLEEARELWKGVTTDDVEQYQYFVESLQRAENVKSAKELYAKKPNDPEALVQMGLAVLDGEPGVIDGRWDKAIDYFNQALTLKPDFAKAQFGICKAYVQWARLFSDKQKIADEELAKLKKMDKALSDELEIYRKNYMDNGGRGVPGGVVVAPGKLNQ